MGSERQLVDLQRRFAAHLRDPEHVPPPPGIEDRRLQIYRELFLSNVAGLLAGTLRPVLHAILGPERWNRLARDFYRGPPLPDTAVPRDLRRIGVLAGVQDAFHDDALHGAADTAAFQRGPSALEFQLREFLVFGGGHYGADCIDLDSAPPLQSQGGFSQEHLFEPIG